MPWLPRHCAESVPIDRVVAQTARATVGAFCCPVGHPRFVDSGPIERHLIAFPRTSVWIRHEGSQAFLADPTTVTIYNQAQRYRRYPAAPHGDRCDWFAVPDSLAREVVAAFDPAAGESDRPFRHEWSVCTARVYLRQRELFRKADRGDVDALALEEGVIGILADVLRASYQQRAHPLARSRGAAHRHQALADAARSAIARDVSCNTSVASLAAALGTSPFHLCRVFRAVTGTTMHDYRSDLRLRRAMDAFDEGGAGGRSLSVLATSLGYASHSHFVRATQRRLGVSPGRLRSALT